MELCIRNNKRHIVQFSFALPCLKEIDIDIERPPANYKQNKCLSVS